MTALVVVMALATASASPAASTSTSSAGAGACDVDGAGHVSKRIEEVAPALAKGRFAKLFRGLRAIDPETSLDVDERHVKFTLVGERPLPAVHVSLALPSPWAGTVDLTPRAVEGRWCAHASVVLFDKDLREAAIEGFPLDVNVVIAKKGQPQRSLAVKHDGLVFTPDFVGARAGDAGEMRLYVGDGPPDDDALEQDGADHYMGSLAALHPDIVADIRAHPSAQAQRVLFAEVAASLRTGLRLWTPERRIQEIARFDEKAMPPDLRPLLHFWKQELGRRVERSDATAHLIVDDAVIALWIDGVSVFDRKKGTSTNIEIPVPKDAVRAWIVTNEARATGEAPVVHDTRAVLRAGEIYSVTSTFLQHVRGGTRRECVRVVGALPFEKDIRWREISGTATPMLGDDESYRPSVPSAERAISVVPGGDARPFPPVPLIYSYTHPGLYKWSLAKDGGVKLELVDDPTLCTVAH